MCYFSASKLTASESVLVSQITDSSVYLWFYAFRPNLQVHSTIVVRQVRTCNDPVEAQYYSFTLESFPPVCYYCGMTEETLVNDSRTEATVRCSSYNLLFVNLKASSHSPAIQIIWLKGERLIIKFIFLCNVCANCVDYSRNVIYINNLKEVMSC